MILLFQSSFRLSEKNIIRKVTLSISRANDVRPYHSGSSGNYAMRSVGWRRRDRGGAFPKKASENFSEWQSAVKTREEKKEESRIYLPLSIAFLFHSGTFFSSSYIAR